MNQNETVQNQLKDHEVSSKVLTDEQHCPLRFIVPTIVVILIIAILSIYSYEQRKNVVDNAEQVTNQMAEYIASNISDKVDFGKSSIKLAALTISQTMTSDSLDNPSEVISPMISNTPFGGIEYIRRDGIIIMNDGESFDASDRVYYIEGIKGNTGIWNNYHPKVPQETLMNFYTPLIYENEIVGVITGYIEATSDLTPLFETKLYGHSIVGFIVDENDMIICSTMKSQYIQDLSLDIFMDNFHLDDEQKSRVRSRIENATNVATSYKDPDGEGRMCVTTIPNTNWKVAIIVPKGSFSDIITENTKESVITVICISFILILYAAHVLVRNVKRSKVIAAENKRLEETNTYIDKENQRIFAEISEIRDIIASAQMGTWRIVLEDEKAPRMYVDDTMRNLLGIKSKEQSPEKTYADWYNNIKPEALASVSRSVKKMQKGKFDENTYLWIHPKKGERYVRCGGTAQKTADGYVLRGYHYDVDEVVRQDQAKLVMLQDALNDKNEYYVALGTLEGIFYSLHVIDLVEDTVVEFNARDDVKEIVNHKDGAAEMMVEVMSTVTVDEHKEAALEFTDLKTLADRMKGKKIISKEFVGKATGWYLASFITMECDKSGRPTKVMYTTRITDEEKKQEEKLIKKSQTDELTGLLNRRAYEEDIYERNDIPQDENFVYMSLDVNGLKVVNDTLGHAAGDELIIGACRCMTECLGSYGKIYRTGGDEFTAILFCDSNKIVEVIKNFEETIENWSGNLVDNLSISFGWVSKEEEPECSVRQLGVIADQRMYDAKSNYYKKSGVDRRGQKDAHKVLCELYTKILKINITNDTFQVVNMDSDEQIEEKGYSESISEWLKKFGETGYVHPEDLEDYLKATDIDYMRKFFEENEKALRILYRRKYGDDFRQAMLEIVPANDYTSEDQNLFLYVKDI